MKFYISTDRFPNTDLTKNVPHKRENWESPLLDKCNNAYDYLTSLNIGGEFYCHFNSSTQVFTPKYEQCNGMSKEKIDDIIKTINNP
jgi:hypothetical protein